MFKQQEVPEQRIKSIYVQDQRLTAQDFVAANNLYVLTALENSLEYTSEQLCVSDLFSYSQNTLQVKCKFQTLREIFLE